MSGTTSVTVTGPTEYALSLNIDSTEGMTSGSSYAIIEENSSGPVEIGTFTYINDGYSPVNMYTSVLVGANTISPTTVGIGYATSETAGSATLYIVDSTGATGATGAISSYTSAIPGVPFFALSNVGATGAEVAGFVETAFRPR